MVALNATAVVKSRSHSQTSHTATRGPVPCSPITSAASPSRTARLCSPETRPCSSLRMWAVVNQLNSQFLTQSTGHRQRHTTTSTHPEFPLRRHAFGAMDPSRSVTGVRMLPAQIPMPTERHSSRSPGTPSTPVNLRSRTISPSLVSRLLARVVAATACLALSTPPWLKSTV